MQKKYFFIIGALIIFFSTVLGYGSVNIIYANRNLASEYTTILEGFITAYQLLGILIFLIGLKKSYKE